MLERMGSEEVEMVPTDIQKFPWKGKQRDQVASGDGSEVKRLVYFLFSAFVFRDKTRTHWCVDVLMGMIQEREDMDDA